MKDAAGLHNHEKCEVRLRTADTRHGSEGNVMNTLGERLNYVRKKNGYTQSSLAESIGVSRGVIFNIEKNKTVPQAIVVNAICQTLRINKDWLMRGTGKMEDTSEVMLSTKILAELYQVTKDLSEDEQFYLLDIARALR